MTTLAGIDYLRSASGALELRAAAGLDLSGNALLRELTLLRRRLTADQASAVIEQAGLRRRAEAKFGRAAEMLFTPDGFEQSSGERLSAHSAARYRGISRIADLCCGIGGDTLALAREGRVDAYDQDPVRLACAEHNAAVHDVSGRIIFHLADVETVDLCQPTFPDGPPVDAIFFDPSRRRDGHRIFSLADYHPPVALIERWLPAIPAIGVKVAPGVRREEITWSCEQEFVADGPDLKECLLWFGPFAGVARRATLLPDNCSLVSGDGPEPPVDPPAGWLYDPSPAVTRAALVQELALLLGARQLDPRLAYLSGPERINTPLARAYAIESWMPFNLKRLQAHLRACDIGRVEVHRRGAPIEPADLERKLRRDTGVFRLIFVTRFRGQMIAIICPPPSA